jgi:ribosomal protein S18 acetylase RimI-like enzyme
MDVEPDAGPVALRPATHEPADERFLWAMLLQAAHAGDEVASPDDLRAIPALARYVEGWGRPGDVGVIAVVPAGGGEGADHAGGRPVGAAWVRLLVGAGAGYGWVDDATPELAIAVEPGWEGRGVGRAMLARLLADVEGRFPAVSLSVRSDNPARRLYARLGFVEVPGTDVENRVGGTSVTMLRRSPAQGGGAAGHDGEGPGGGPV